MLERDTLTCGIISYTDDSEIHNQGVLDVAVLDVLKLLNLVE